jgi:3-hydroxyacyl-CoA dehydrogenase/enoyl-CoA hydratase/3-hydroxybutyryl-CoA epimerase
MSTTTEAVRYEKADGIVTLVIDDPSQSTNTMNQAYRDSMEHAVNQLVDEIAADGDSIKGVIVSSGKKTFFAGGDLKLMTQATPADAEEIFENIESIKATLRKLETCGKPVVAAVNGAALGGGLEIALACHHRIAAAGGYEIGLPEVTLGLLPGGGGVTRTVRMFGIQDAMLNVLLEGPRMKPPAAQEKGLVDEIVDTQDELLPAAKAWIESVQGDEAAASQPWDRQGYKIPGGTPSSPKLAAVLPAFPSNLRKQTKGAPYKAPRNIMAAAVEGSQVDFETATRIESRYLVELIVGQQFKNMTQAFFFDLGAVNSGRSRPKDVATREVRKVAVLGAGMMGAGIAYSCARAGLDVVLKDVSTEAAEKGRAHTERLLAKAVSRGRTTEAARDAVLARITATCEPGDLASCDAVIEAVFEDSALKQKVLQEAQEIVAPDALLCSNTSTLPITALAGGVSRPADFVGLHFFSPVDKMPLVEIVRGRETGEEALARAFDLVRQIGKTPIVVNDSRGFFTSRVIGKFLDEGVAMVGEGVEPASIEQAAASAGYPAKVLSLMDELTLTLPRKIRNETRRAVEEAGGHWTPHPADAVVDRMVEEFGRAGRAAGAGFYEYGADGGRTRLWPGLREHFTASGTEVPFADMRERMLFAEALETVRCLEEGVLTSVADANIGSIMGIGFPAWTGGVLQYINGYEGGLPGFAARANDLADRYGDRFRPPALLTARAESGVGFTDG